MYVSFCIEIIELIYIYIFSVVNTIEFQKKGLPHAHILLFLHANAKIESEVEIDEFISAEIPDKNVDPIGYELVSRFMLHGPCGSKCKRDNVCSKYFPKNFNTHTTFDGDGFPNYRRREDGRFFEKKIDQAG